MVDAETGEVTREAEREWCGVVVWEETWEELFGGEGWRDEERDPERVCVWV